MGLVNGLTDPSEDENQWRNLMFKITKEATRPYDLKTDDWCMFAGCINSEDGRQSFETITQEGENMVDYGQEGCSYMRDERQFFDTVMELENKVTTHSYIRNREKNCS